MKKPAFTPRLEATYSTDEVLAFLGIKRTQLFELIKLGRRYKGCHPTRGGLYPTLKVSHKNRRIFASALERHQKHMARVHDGIAA